MSNSNNQTYNKYYVKKDHNSGAFMEENGKPVMGDLMTKNIKCPANFIEVLNETWRNSGIYYQLVKEDQGDGGKSPERIELEKEATELGVPFRESIGDDKLKQKIEAAKQN